MTYDYDALDRPTRVTYPDGAYEETTYDRLDVATRRDRRGRLTRYTYNARRQLVAVRDPAGRVVQQQWGLSGTLDALVDANAHTTRWERDLMGRVLREIRADNLTTTRYTYDSLGRLRTVTDPKQQLTTYSYVLDGAVASVGYTNAQIPTPGVTWSYDPAYARVTTMVDGTGTTNYTYHAAGALGAGQVATVDGPLQNDVISYSYDELGRVVTRAIDGVPLTLTYDPLGRVEREVNALGTFTYTYDGPTGRLATVTYPNGQTSAYAYFPANQDHRLQTIHHKYPTGATLSKFDYTYDAVGNILTWRQQADTTAVVWEYGYDHADQLTRAVKRATDPQGSILQRFAYGYDPAGNRLFEQIDDQVTSWTYDKLNRLVDQRAGGLLKVAGSVSEPSAVRVNGQPASVDAGGLFVGGVSAGTGTSSFTVMATDASGNTATKTYEIDQTGAPKGFQFDANGNMTSDGTRTYEWDAENRLGRTVTPNGSYTFFYDGRHRRTRYTIDSGSGPIEGTMLWCGVEICEDRQAQRNLRFTSLGMQSVEPLYVTTDHRYSVRQITKSDGTLVSLIDFDPFGGTLQALPENVQLSFARQLVFAGLDIGFTWFRAYDSRLGRWLSEDPARFVDGPNRYAFVRNRVLRDIDPWGLQAASIGACPPPCEPYLHEDVLRGCLLHNLGNPQILGEAAVCVMTGLIHPLVAAACGAVVAAGSRERCVKCATYCDKTGPSSSCPPNFGPGLPWGPQSPTIPRR